MASADLEVKGKVNMVTSTEEVREAQCGRRKPTRLAECVHWGKDRVMGSAAWRRGENQSEEFIKSLKMDFPGPDYGFPRPKFSCSLPMAM